MDDFQASPLREHSIGGPRTTEIVCIWHHVVCWEMPFSGWRSSLMKTKAGQKQINEYTRGFPNIISLGDTCVPCSLFRTKPLKNMTGT